MIEMFLSHLFILIILINLLIDINLGRTAALSSHDMVSPNVHSELKFSKGSLIIPAWNSINVMLQYMMLYIHSVPTPQAGAGVMPLAPGIASPGRTGLTASTLIGFFQGRF